MKSHRGSFLREIFAFTLIALSSASANAALYTFLQDGFSGGGVVTGSFEAEDLDNDGLISSFSELFGEDEIKSFSFSFTNDSIVGDFSAIWFNGLEYEIGSGFIGIRSGDGLITGAGSSGIATDEFDFRRFDYESGKGPTGGTGGRVIDSSTGAISTTSNLISVSESAVSIPAAVPIPAAVWLFGTSIVGLIGMRRKGLRASENSS